MFRAEIPLLRGKWGHSGGAQVFLESCRLAVSRARRAKAKNSDASALLARMLYPSSAELCANLGSHIRGLSNMSGSAMGLWPPRGTRILDLMLKLSSSLDAIISQIAGLRMNDTAKDAPAPPYLRAIAFFHFPKGLPVQAEGYRTSDSLPELAGSACRPDSPLACGAAPR